MVCDNPSGVLVSDYRMETITWQLPKKGPGRRKFYTFLGEGSAHFGDITVFNGLGTKVSFSSRLLDNC